MDQIVKSPSPRAPYPNTPVRQFSFTDFSVNNPTTPQPGDRIDSEYDRTNASTAQIITWASVSLNTDGTIRAGVVGSDQLVSGLFDDVAQGIIDDVQPLVDDAQSYANAASASSITAQAAATAADTSNSQAQGAAGAAQTAATSANTSVTTAQSYAFTAQTAATSAGNAGNHADGAAALAQDYADVTEAWAEHMPDTIPPNILAVMGITGDHWSSRWWANKAEAAFGALTSLYLGAWSTPPTSTATGDLIPVGGIYYDTTTQQPYVWTGSEWRPFWAPTKALTLTLMYAATSNQTVFTTTTRDLAGNSWTFNAATPEPVEVSVNGVRLPGNENAFVGDWVLDPSHNTVTFARPLLAGTVVLIDVLTPADLLAPSAVTTRQVLSFDIDPATGNPGQIDGVRTTFSLALADRTPLIINTPLELLVFIDGVTQIPGTDYVPSSGGSTITFSDPPLPGAVTWGLYFTGANPGTPGSGVYLPVAGGTMTGMLTLAGPPTLPLSAATKAYVDGWGTGQLGALRLTAYVQAGDPDDTAALGRMVAAWSALPGGGAMLFPTQRETNLSAGVTINVAQGKALTLGADGNGDARIRFASTFTGTAFTITESASSSGPEGPLVRMQGLTFISTWATVSGQGFSITAAAGGNVAPSPSCYIQGVRFQNDGGGSWQQAGSLFAMNVTRVRAFTCFGFKGASVGLSYDTDTRISVEHDIDDFYMNGGGTGLSLGHAGATGPLQGFTIRRPSFTGCANGIVATCASNLDQLIVTGGQINVTGNGISLTNVTTPVISSNYFLNCGTASRITGGTRHVITGNAFDLGQPTTTPGNGTNNLAVVMSGTSGAPDAGSVVSGNLFTNVVGAVACVQLVSGTNYVHCTGNLALQGTVVSDTTGNNNNTDFGNYAAGGINAIYLGTGTPATKPSVKTAGGNITITPASGANVFVPGTVGIQPSDGSTTTFLRTELAGDLMVNTQGLKLATRVGKSDTPQLMFAYNTTGTGTPSLGYNPGIKSFVFNNENAAPAATIDVNGVIRNYGGLTFNTAPSNAANDAVAASAGVPVGGVYRNGSQLMVRVA